MKQGVCEPPAPVARGRVDSLAGDSASDVPLLLDSGADVSVIPRDIAVQVHASIEPSGARLQNVRR